MKTVTDQMEKGFFQRGNPLKKLLRITLDLLQAQQVGVLYGTNASKIRFLPASDWDRGVMDMFDGYGFRGCLLRYFGTFIVRLKKLSPVYFFKKNDQGQLEDNDGIIAYMLRTCANYYTQGISILFSPDISSNIYKIDDRYVEIPFYSYNGEIISEPDIKVRVDLNIIKHFKAKNYVSIYIPDYGILVVNTVDPDLMAQLESRFIREEELKEKFDLMIQMVEMVSLASLGQLKGKRGAHLLWEKEKLLRRTSQELITNEKKYRDLYENAPVAYFSMDARGILTKCNYNTLKLSGYTREELIGKNILKYHVESDDEKTSPDRIFAMLAQGRTARDIEIKFKNKNNQHIWISLSLDTVRDKQGKIVEIRAMAIDISERKSLEKQLLYAQKMEAIGTLAGGIAHDFNNILSPISGYSEMLLMETGDEDPKKREHLQIIYDCAMYAKGLVNQMLTFSKQKDNELKLLQPHIFVEDALALAKSFLPATIEVRTRINSDCGLIMVDPVQVHQVVMNLISNAYHAMEENGGVLEVCLDEATIKEDNLIFPISPGSYIYLKISDTGPGMSAAVMERIFDPFFTTKKEGKGSGIGLSVVHGIIQSHKGYITVSSQEGQGSTFEVYLPVYTGNDKPEEKIKEDRPIQKGTEHILLVDDDKKVAFMVQHMLEKLGYHVTCHLDSPGAAEAFAKAPDAFDLVVTDLTMPDLTGYQLAQKLTEIRSDIPIILCTGFGEHINKKQYGLQGIKGFLNKPVSVKDVSRLIRDILDGAGR
ncbi:MAG: PAS domain S-box protein [Proteobacteria bacterium]|nr:PAS domain S-box protein [Pseudomonadota bacterium]